MTLNKDGFEVYLSIIKIAYGKTKKKDPSWIVLSKNKTGYRISGILYYDYNSFWKQIQELKILEVEQSNPQGDEPHKLDYEL